MAEASDAPIVRRVAVPLGFVLSVPLGFLLSVVQVRPALGWLLEGREPDREEQLGTLRGRSRETRVARVRG